MGSQTILVATLGGQPQVVIFALCALLAQGEVVQAVYVLHPAPLGVRLARLRDCLRQGFSQQQYAGQLCTLRSVALVCSGEPLAAIRDAVEATWRTIRQLLASLKSEGHKLHLWIAGGRRLMGLWVTSAAMLLRARCSAAFLPAWLLLEITYE